MSRRPERIGIEPKGGTVEHFVALRLQRGAAVLAKNKVRQVGYEHFGTRVIPKSFIPTWPTLHFTISCQDTKQDTKQEESN
jgi:hypothetical protein